ncbi:MAG: CzcE family metal-binding protein [Rhodocyclaceae bacterium]|nr:CzcE family metal-binding protein [Rhodocyclaceae bacterium]
MRKPLILALVAMAGIAGAGVTTAYAYEDVGTTFGQLAYDSQPSANERAPLGYAANAHASRAVNLDKGAKYLNVTRMETVQINVGGKSVAWTFDTLGTPVFPLSKIIPGAEGITVYVSEDPSQLG